MLPDFPARQLIRSGRPFSIGTGSVEMSEAELRQRVDAHPCDLLFVDLQHAPYTEPQLASFCAAAAAVGAPALLRIRHPRLACQISSLLDFGAAGVLIPMAEDPSVVADAIEAFYYPPVGERSVGPRLAFHYADFNEPRGYADWWNAHGVLALQIETVQGVARVRDLAVPGVHLLLFGANDLSFSLEAHPECPWDNVAECQQYVLEQTRDLDVRVGVGDMPFGRF